MHKCVKKHQKVDQYTFKSRPDCQSCMQSSHLRSWVIFSVLLSSTTWLLCRERKQFFVGKPWRVLLSLMCSVSYLSLQRTIFLAPELGTYSPLHGKGPLARKRLVVSQQAHMWLDVLVILPLPSLVFSKGLFPFPAWTTIQALDFILSQT